MTTFEAGMWIAGALFTACLIFAGIGAHFEEKKQHKARNVSYMGAVALFGMSAVCAGKALLTLIIN